MAGRRLEAPAGAWIDRSRSVGFSFNGRPLRGFRGDTLASALLANGVRLVGRSFKLHRPRGIFSCGIEEPCAVVDLGRGARRTPNVRATLLPLVEGLEAVSVNCWPSVGFDLGALTGACAAFLPAGFYYKTFMWPSWRVFEPAIRGMAGLGQAPRLPDPDHYEEKAADADVLVVGGGIAGLAAAVAAAHAGAHTMLLAGSARLGGALGASADYEVGALLAALGTEIAAIVDRRAGAAPIAGAAGLRVMTGAVLRAVHGARSVRGCTVASLEGGRRERIHCDLVLNAGGYAPAVHLHSQAGGKLRWVPESAMFVPDGTAPGVASVGACAGVFARGAGAHAGDP